MIDKLVGHIIRFKKVWGIHIEETSPDCYQIDAVLMEYRKGTVFLLEKRQFSFLEELIELLKDIVPVSLSYSGKKVLLKSIDNNGITNLAEVLHISDPDQFYIQELKSGTNSFFSVIRKSQFDPIFLKFKESGLKIISVSLAPANIVGLLPFLEFETTTVLSAGDFSIEVDKNIILNIKSGGIVPDFELPIGGETLLRSEIIPYCNALAVFYGGGSSEDILQSEWKHLLMEAKHKLFFKKALPFCLVTIFLLLLGNFILLQFQTKKHERLTAELVNYQGQLIQLKKLTADFKDKQLIGSKLKLNNYRVLSFYSDRIAKSIDDNIRLLSLVINPKLETNSRQKDEYVFEPNIILVKGTCRSSLDLNLWLRKLESLDFVEEIKDQLFQFDEHEEKGIFSLTIKVINQ